MSIIHIPTLKRLAAGAAGLLLLVGAGVARAQDPEDRPDPWQIYAREGCCARCGFRAAHCQAQGLRWALDCWTSMGSCWAGLPTCSDCAEYAGGALSSEAENVEARARLHRLHRVADAPAPVAMDLELGAVEPSGSGPGGSPMAAWGPWYARSHGIYRDPAGDGAGADDLESGHGPSEATLSSLPQFGSPVRSRVTAPLNSHLFRTPQTAPKPPVPRNTL